MRQINAETESSSLPTPTDGNFNEFLLPRLQSKGNIYAKSFTAFSRQPEENTKKQLQYVLGIPIIFTIIPAYYGGVQFSYPDYALAQKPTHHSPIQPFTESHSNGNLLQQQAINTQQPSFATKDPTYDIDIRNIVAAKESPDKKEKYSIDPAIGEPNSSNDFIIHYVKDVNKPAGDKRIVDFRIEETVIGAKDDALVAGIDDAIHFIENGTEQGISSPLEITTRRRIEGLPIEDEELEVGSGLGDRINAQVIKTLVG